MRNVTDFSDLQAYLRDLMIRLERQERHTHPWDVPAVAVVLPTPIEPEPECVSWSDDFERADGPVGSNWVPYDPQMGWGNSGFVIASGAAAVIIPPSPRPGRMAAGMRWHEAQPVDQTIEILVDNVYGNNGYYTLFTHASDENFGAQVAEFNFYDDDVGPDSTGGLFIYGYRAVDATTWTQLASNEDSPWIYPPGGVDRGPVRLRHTARADGTQEVYVNDVQVLTWTDSAPDGSYVAIGTFIWTHLGSPYTSPLVLSVTGGCLE